MKPYAILHSKFEEVLFIDVDNIPVRNPEFLFDSLPYRETGAIFWPDIWRLAPHRLIWSICGIDFRDEREFESGQIVIDKRRCWKALNVAMHLNEYSDFYYQHFLGDKETFHLAWMKLGQKYSMPARNAELRDNTLFQYDFEDKLLFQHRNGDKWRLKPRNKPIPGFQLEEVCFFFLDQLDVLLDEGSRKVRRWVPVNRSSRALETAQRLLGQRYVYFGHGQESRVIGLAANGTTKTGPERRERFWDLLENGEELSLEVSSENEPLFQVKAGPDGIWRGQTCGEERSSVEIVPQREHIGVAPLERIRTLSGHANGTPALSIENGAANPAQLARRFAASFPAHHTYCGYQFHLAERRHRTSSDSMASSTSRVESGNLDRKRDHPFAWVCSNARWFCRLSRSARRTFALRGRLASRRVMRRRGRGMPAKHRAVVDHGHNRGLCRLRTTGLPI